MTDWEAIKKEYVTTAVSYRALAEKWGVELHALSQRGHREGWVALRKAQAPLRAPEQEKRLQRLLEVTDKLLGKLEQMLDAWEPSAASCNALRHYSGTLKDIKDIQMLRSDADIREQEAKIEGMLRRSETELSEQGITVVLEGEVSAYAT